MRTKPIFKKKQKKIILFLVSIRDYELIRKIYFRYYIKSQFLLFYIDIRTVRFLI